MVSSFYCFLVLFLGLISTTHSLAIEAHYSHQKLVIDGQAKEVSWQRASWQPIDKAIIGELPDPLDFFGRYKVLWDETALFFLVEITDDIFSDQTQDPLKNYWNDDCLEVFIDEDKSGGEHLNNFNAFAYHLALDGNVVDIVGENANKSGKPALFNHHVKHQFRYITPHKILWELKVRLYGDDYRYGDELYVPKPLKKDQTLGFMLSYCDNDGGLKRESFIGSLDIAPQKGSKNLGYITADVFDELKLIE